VYRALPILDGLTLERVVALRDQGATIVDVRAVADYAAAHIPGSLSNVLRPQFSSWLGWLVNDPTAPLVFVADDHTDRRELIRQCLNVGYENIAGTITVGAWRAGGGDLRGTTLVPAGEIGDRQVVDVRQVGEFASGHIPDAANIELGEFAHGDAALPEGPLALMCGHGERGATAASLLEARGHDDLAITTGGPDDWATRTHQPLEQ
jgi:rhodanese-related sulfurtransferase